MKARIYFFSIILFSLTFLTVPSKVQPLKVEAADLTIDCPSQESGKCALSGTNPLFTTSDGVWYPGRTLTKSVSVKNSGANGKNISFQARRSSLADEIFEQAFLVSVTPSDSDTITFGGNLTNFYDKDRISFGAFNSNQTKEFVFQVKMDTNAGNDTKGKESNFNATIGFWEESATTAPCADPAPSSAPTLVSVTRSKDQATLIWLPAAGTVTYYAVYYGTSSGSSSFLNPNVGGSSTVSHTAQGLTNSTYYFRIRAGNGCAQSSFSNERVVSLGQVSEEFPLVLSGEKAETEVQQQGQQEGRVKTQESQGVKGETAPPEPISFIDTIFDFIKKNPAAAAVAIISVSIAAGSVLWQFSRKP